MRYLTLTALLASTVAALDIRLWTSSSNCQSGSFYYCQNADPNVCCHVPSGTAKSVQFIPYPSNWRIRPIGFSDSNCKNAANTGYSYGVTQICLSSFGPFKSGNYHFINAKRAPEAEGSVDITPGNAGDCLRANFYVASNGTETSLSHLNDAQYKAFVTENN